MSLDTKLIVALTATQASTLDLASAQVPLSVRQVLELTSGTGAGKADLVFSDRRTVAASSSDSLDLAAGLTDALGTSLTFARIKAILIVAAKTNVNNVVVGGAASNGFATAFGDATDKIVLRPGALLALAAGQADATGYAVTPSTGDLLQIANSGAGSAVVYDIVLIGASA
ncbi:hypothetical protein ACWEN6_25025 [Sphaerisporangium sp. NPDC004334]